MDVETILVALIVSVIAPGTLALITNRQRRIEKKEDYRRQDEVAERVQKASNLLVKSTDKVVAASIDTNAKIEQVHILVNAATTALVQEKFNGVLREIELLKRLKTIRSTAEDREAMQAALARAEELRLNLYEREKQTVSANKKVDNQEKKLKAEELKSTQEAE